MTKNLNFKTLICPDNPNLTCIQILNSHNKSYWSKDATADYSEDCNYTTSINEEIIIQPKTVQAIYNIQGQQVNITYQGFVIIPYTDGTCEKIMQ